jgi:hypothetical protein
MPMSWTTYYMGLGPSDKLQYTLHVSMGAAGSAHPSRALHAKPIGCSKSC